MPLEPIQSNQLKMFVTVTNPQGATLAAAKTPENNKEINFAPASLTKMMTLLVANDYARTHPKFFSKYAGEVNRMMHESSNIASDKIASDIGSKLLKEEGEKGGGKTHFIQLMNKKAEILGLSARFNTASGMPQGGLAIEQHITGTDANKLAQALSNTNDPDGKPLSDYMKGMKSAFHTEGNKGVPIVDGKLIVGCKTGTGGITRTAPKDGLPKTSADTPFGSMSMTCLLRDKTAITVHVPNPVPVSDAEKRALPPADQITRQYNKAVMETARYAAMILTADAAAQQSLGTCNLVPKTLEERMQAAVGAAKGSVHAIKAELKSCIGDNSPALPLRMKPEVQEVEAPAKTPHKAPHGHRKKSHAK